MKIFKPNERQKFKCDECELLGKRKKATVGIEWYGEYHHYKFLCPTHAVDFLTGDVRLQVEKFLKGKEVQKDIVPLEIEDDFDASGLKDDLKPLKRFLRECRPDCHEPDEQGISAKVKGRHLDNAMGNSGACGEYVVVLKKDLGRKKSETFQINLATLLALARKAHL